MGAAWYFRQHKSNQMTDKLNKAQQRTQITLQLRLLKAAAYLDIRPLQRGTATVPFELSRILYHLMKQTDAGVIIQRADVKFL